MEIGLLPPEHECDDRLNIQLVPFRRARRPQSPALNNVQLRQQFGKPKKKVSLVGVKSLKELHQAKYSMCGTVGQWKRHQLYEW